MPQKLTLISILTLLVLAGAGTVLVASHAFDRGNPSDVQGLSTPQAGTGSTRTTGSASSNSTATRAGTTDSTTTTASSTSASTQSSGSSGSLLLSGQPASTGRGSDDGTGSDDHGAMLAGNSTSGHLSGDD